ncbi:MAG TPA: hypothetical protein VF635_01635, partial [Propionibacteriaceae bacterium]
RGSLSEQRPLASRDSGETSRRDQPDPKQRARAALEADNAIKAYQAAVVDRDFCLATGNRQSCAAVVPPPNEPQVLDADGVVLEGTYDPTTPAPAPEPIPVAVSPQQAAYIAFARLKLTAPRPQIGPAPSLNRWDMAAVGYPLWLWSEGNTNPAPVSDSAGGLFVSLDADVSKIVYDMGDGTTVTCTGVGTKWGPWVTAGQASPDCGHVYEKPSLPKGSYTVTATTHWSVAWTVTGQTGVIPFIQSAQTTIPVGELQVLVR